MDAALDRLVRFREVLEGGSFIEQKEFLRAFVIGIDLDPKALTTGWTPGGTKKTPKLRKLRFVTEGRRCLPTFVGLLQRPHDWVISPLFRKTTLLDYFRYFREVHGLLPQATEPTFY